MISLFTDFGWNGPYVGQLKLALHKHSADVVLVDLMHDAPAYNPHASAWLLAALNEHLPQGGVCLAVVDPGVGDPRRRPCIVKVDGRWFVGPDNGLFNVLIQRGDEVECREITWRPSTLSASFHGRDLFAPVAAMLARGEMPDTQALAPDTMLGACDLPEDLSELIYFDHYGNAVTGTRAKMISEEAVLYVNKHKVHYARTFYQVTKGQIFWYENANGLVEFAMNCGSAQQELQLSIGDKFHVIA